MAITISNQRALKSRVSAGWSHDSRQFKFDRTHTGPAFEKDAEGISWGEAFLWFVGTLALFGLIFYALHFL
jgi:hypothetical protein